MLRGLIVLLFIAAGGLASADVLTPHSAEYKVRISVVGGRLTTRLAAAGDSLTAHHVVRPTGLARVAVSGEIDETSTFRLVDHELLPQRYRSRDELSSDKTQASVEFAFDDGEIRGVINGAQATFPLQPGTYDRVSVQYRLMQALVDGERPERFRLYDIDEIKDIEVKYLPEQEIRTPAGVFRVIGVQHRKTGSSRSTTLWCAAALDYLPVRIEQYKNDELRMRANLVSYTPDPDAN